MLSAEGKLQSLEWMGIKPLQARSPLPNASFSSVFYENARVALFKDVAAPEASLPKVKNDLSALFDSTKIPTQARVTKTELNDLVEVKPEITLDVPATEQAQLTPHISIQPFRIRYLLIDNTLCLLNQPKRQWAEQEAGCRFLSDLAMALNKKLPATTITDTFQWPTAKGLPENDWGLVTEIMVNFFKGQFADKPPSITILFFGWESFFEKDLAREKALLEVFDKLSKSLSSKKNFTALAPLAHYLADPGAKSQLWQKLRYKV